MPSPSFKSRNTNYSPSLQPINLKLWRKSPDTALQSLILKPYPGILLHPILITPAYQVGTPVVHAVSLGVNTLEVAQTSGALGSGGAVVAGDIVTTIALVGTAMGVYVGTCQTKATCGILSASLSMPIFLRAKMVMLRRTMSAVVTVDRLGRLVGIF